MAEVYLGKQRLLRFGPASTIRRRSHRFRAKVFAFILEMTLFLPCLVVSLGQQSLSELGRYSGGSAL